MEVRVIIQKSLVSGLSPASAWALQLPPHPTARLAPHPHPQHTFSLTHRLATDRDQEGHCAKPRPLEWLHCSWAEFPEPAGAALTRAGLCSVRCPRAAGQGLTTPGRTPLLPSFPEGGGEEPQKRTDQTLAHKLGGKVVSRTSISDVYVWTCAIKCFSNWTVH